MTDDDNYINEIFEIVKRHKQKEPEIIEQPKPKPAKKKREYTPEQKQALLDRLAKGRQKQKEMREAKLKEKVDAKVKEELANKIKEIEKPKIEEKPVERPKTPEPVVDNPVKEPEPLPIVKEEVIEPVKEEPEPIKQEIMPPQSEPIPICESSRTSMKQRFKKMRCYR